MNILDGHEVFSALGRLADGAVSSATDGGWRCRRAVPRMGGSLFFDLENPDQTARLDWFGPVADGGPRLKWIDKPAGKTASKAHRALARLLGDLESDPGFLLLGFQNRDLSELRFDDEVVDVLLAGRFGPGKTRWFDYRFQDSFQQTSRAFQLTFDGPGGAMVFEVREAGGPAGGGEGERLMENRLFSFHLVHDPRTPDQRKLLAHQVERFLGFLLCRAVHPGMRLSRATAPKVRGGGKRRKDAGGRSAQEEQVPDEQVQFDGAPVSTTRWGNPEQWYQFFSDFEVERSSLCSVRFTDPISEVVHGEMECKGIEPNTFGRRADFANPPWPMEPREFVPGSESHFTGLVEQDAIMGGTAKLERAIEKAISNPRVRMVCLNNTCLPKIIGDDVASVVARMRATSKIPILSMNTDLDSPDAAFRDLVRQARDAAAGHGPMGDGEGLNLIGFPPGSGRRELTAQLQDLGIRVNICLIPEFGVDDLRRYMGGRTGLLYPHGPWIELADRILGDLRVPFERLPAPYGMRRTREWFRQASRAVDRPDAFDLWEQRYHEPALAAFEELAAQVKGLRLAFVVDAASLERLVDPALLYGFEIAALLEEMGFGLDVMIRRNTAVHEPPGEILSALTDPDRHTFTAFADPAQLAGLLRDGEFQAVYSEVFFDRRITRAGKAQFHLGMLELGLDGALRGIQRLVELCRWPFYRRYRDHMEGQKRRERTR